MAEEKTTREILYHFTVTTIHRILAEYFPDALQTLKASWLRLYHPRCLIAMTKGKLCISVHRPWKQMYELLPFEHSSSPSEMYARIRCVQVIVETYAAAFPENPEHLFSFITTPQIKETVIALCFFHMPLWRKDRDIFLFSSELFQCIKNTLKLDIHLWSRIVYTLQTTTKSEIFGQQIGRSIEYVASLSNSTVKRKYVDKTTLSEREFEYLRKAFSRCVWCSYGPHDRTRIFSAASALADAKNAYNELTTVSLKEPEEGKPSTPFVVNSTAGWYMFLNRKNFTVKDGPDPFVCLHYRGALEGLTYGIGKTENIVYCDNTLGHSEAMRFPRDACLDADIEDRIDFKPRISPNHEKMLFFRRISDITQVRREEFTRSDISENQQKCEKELLLRRSNPDIDFERNNSAFQDFMCSYLLWEASQEDALCAALKKSTYGQMTN